LDKATEKLSRAKQVDGPVRRSHDDREARRLKEAGLAYFNLKQSELADLRRNDPRKVMLARLIRQRTSVANAWIARELALGHASSLSRYSGRVDKLDVDPELKNLIECLESRRDDNLPRF
jgi:hypothetical protein